MLATTAAPGCYARRTPETTVLHVVVREHLETFLCAVRDERGKSLPKYVEDELRRYVRCGILAHGFVRVACPVCRKEILVGMSCKCRGACPSCSVRRMCGTAAHLVDSVLPDAAMRQWVLTAPFEIRRVMALRPDALSACNRIFVEEISRFRRASAGLAGAETGSVTFVQRFNSTLGVFVHLPRRRCRRSLHNYKRNRSGVVPSAPYATAQVHSVAEENTSVLSSAILASWIS